MEKFKLNGFYNYDPIIGGKGKLEGEIELYQDNSFKGSIQDIASINPQQAIQGHFIRGLDIERLVFIKFPVSQNIAKLVYDLTKNGNGNIIGDYQGTWKALPYKITFNENSKIFLADITYDPSVKSIGDVAEISVAEDK